MAGRGDSSIATAGCSAATSWSRWAFWILVLIVLPQLVMLDFSLRHDLPPAQRGGPEDVWTLANYRYFLFGFPGNPEGWNFVDLAVFAPHPRRRGAGHRCSTS